MQRQLLPGSLHWLVAATHLLVGVIAIAAASRLASAVASRSIHAIGRRAEIAR